MVIFDWQVEALEKQALAKWGDKAKVDKTKAKEVKPTKEEKKPEPEKTSQCIKYISFKNQILQPETDNAITQGWKNTRINTKWIKGFLTISDGEFSFKPSGFTTQC